MKELKNIQIGPYTLGENQPPFIIAEMSGNHNNDFDKAMSIVEEAAKAGAHALKLQTYTADTLTIDLKEREFLITDPKSLWVGKSLYELYEEANTPWEWHQPIFKRCAELGMVGFSAPFDATAVDYLEKLNVPCYKIASFENVDLPLLRKVAATGKPLFVSTGMANLEEMNDIVKTVHEAGCKDLILLKCTSMYPSDAREANIKTIPHMRELFGCHVGLSDHTLGIGVAIASVALGAMAIEKHFILSREDEGVDSKFSIEPHELNALVEETSRAQLALGEVRYQPTDAEKSSIQFKRSLYIVKDLKKGDLLSSENVRSIRPGHGLPVKFFDIVLNKPVTQDIARGTALNWDLIGMVAENTSSK